MKSAVLFDLDNTLTDRYVSITTFAGKFYNDFSRSIDRNVGFKEVHDVILTSDENGYRSRERMFDLWLKQIRWKKPPPLKTLRAYWYATAPTCMTLRPGVIETLEALRSADYRLGIVTNGTTSVQNQTIDAIGVRKYMDVIVISEEAGARKPDVAIFERALAALDIESAYFVGDHPYKDVEAAMAAGLTAIWLSDGKPWPGGPVPHFDIESFGQLVSVIHR